MSDVRLVATNPEDSSVVPVAANNRGELLTVAPVIEKIPNDVEIDGQLRVNGGLVDANGDPISGGGVSLPPDPYEGALLGWLNGELSWVGPPPVELEEGVFGPITEVSEDGMAITVDGEIPPAIGTGVYVYQCNPAGEIYVPTWNTSQVWSAYWGSGVTPGYNTEITASFDGSTTTTFATVDNAWTWLPWTPPAPIAYTERVEIYWAHLTNGFYRLNGADHQALVQNSWTEVASGSGQITSIDVTRGSVEVHSFWAVRVDGKILVDGGAYPAAPNLNFRVQSVAGNVLVGVANRTDVPFSVGSYLKVPSQRVAPWVLYGGDPASLADHHRHKND